MPNTNPSQNPNPNPSGYPSRRENVTVSIILTFEVGDISLTFECATEEELRIIRGARDRYLQRGAALPAPTPTPPAPPPTPEPTPEPVEASDLDDATPEEPDVAEPVEVVAPEISDEPLTMDTPAQATETITTAPPVKNITTAPTIQVPQDLAAEGALINGNNLDSRVTAIERELREAGERGLTPKEIAAALRKRSDYYMESNDWEQAVSYVLTRRNADRFRSNGGGKYTLLEG